MARWGVVLLGITTFSVLGCEWNQSPRVIGKGVAVVFDFEGRPNEYADGFVCFIAFLKNGKAEVPVRYELVPRKGFMDHVYLQNRAQDPPFWASPVPAKNDEIHCFQELTLEIAPPIEGMLVAHRTRDQKEWKFSKIKLDAAEHGKNPVWKVTLKVRDLGDAGFAAAEIERSAAIEALGRAEKETSAIRNRD